MDLKGQYKMASFARMTGISSAVLRAWERRYGLLRPERLAGGHRLYTDDDLAVIEGAKVLLAGGRSIGEVAARGRETLLAERRARVGASPGRAVIPLDAPTEALREQIVRAAVEIDGELLRSTLDELFARLSPRAAVFQVIEPAAREIGERWARGQVSVAGEHLVSSHLTFRLRQLLEAAQGSDRRDRSVICGCLPGENHEIGLLVVALKLATSGYQVIYLGPMLPIDDLDRACERLEPAAVCLSVSLPETLAQQSDALARFARHRGGQFGIHLGGPGVPEHHAELERAGVSLWPPARNLDELLQSLGSRAVAERAHR